MPNKITDILIHNIWAVGRNYADHAKELGHATPESHSDPMIFLKAGSTIVENGETFSLPRFSHDVHHECEIALQFANVERGHVEFSHITVALDLTARDIQNELKKKAHPWTLAKSFKSSCPIGPLTPLAHGLDLQNLHFALSVNGQIRQRGASSDMIHSIEKVAKYVLAHFPVRSGDLLLTGTPAGVAPLHRGDRISAEIEGVTRAEWNVSKD
jgi:acylpyruvate hydrolase